MSEISQHYMPLDALTYESSSPAEVTTMITYKYITAS